MLHAMKLVIPTIAVVTFSAAAQTSRSVWDGVYTPEQANRGKTDYVEQCASCHGVALGGGDETPALAGARFLAHWDNQSVAALFERIRTSMPPDRPGTLSRQTEADILAHIFAANQFPPGRGELSGQNEPLKQIQFQSRVAARQQGPPQLGGAGLPSTPSRSSNGNAEPVSALVEGQPIERRPPEKSDNKPAFPEQTRAPYRASAPFRVTTLIDNMPAPWSLAFLPS